MKPKFKAGDYLVDKYMPDSTIFIKRVIDSIEGILDNSCYIVDYLDGEPPVIRSVKCIQKYYKLA